MVTQAASLLAALFLKEELVSCRFSIDIEGMILAVFTECSGLSGEVEVEGQVGQFDVQPGELMALVEA